MGIDCPCFCGQTKKWFMMDILWENCPKTLTLEFFDFMDKHSFSSVPTGTIAKDFFRQSEP
jgi:hypothetical protein